MNWAFGGFKFGIANHDDALQLLGCLHCPLCAWTGSCGLEEWCYCFERREVVSLIASAENLMMKANDLGDQIQKRSKGEPKCSFTC